MDILTRLPAAALSLYLHKKISVKCQKYKNINLNFSRYFKFFEIFLNFCKFLFTERIPEKNSQIFKGFPNFGELRKGVFTVMGGCEFEDEVMDASFIGRITYLLLSVRSGREGCGCCGGHHNSVVCNQGYGYLKERGSALKKIGNCISRWAAVIGLQSFFDSAPLCHCDCNFHREKEEFILLLYS